MSFSPSVHLPEDSLVGGRTERQEALAESLGLTVPAVDEREVDLGVEELLGGLPADLSGGDLLHVDDLDAGGAGTMVGGHVAVHLLDGAAAGDVTVLLVDVVGAVKTVVTQEDGEVLHSVGATLSQLLAGKNLTGGGLHLAHLGQEVPETRLGDDLVRSEDAHAVDLLLSLVGGVALTADNLIFLHSFYVCAKTKKKHN